MLMPELHVRKYTTPRALVSAIVARFKWMEEMDLRVGAAWMHPTDIATLSKDSAVFDRMAQQISQQIKPDLRGHFFGVLVFESSVVPEEHIVLLPAGFDLMNVKLLGPEASIRL
jgi:hypothetical protein